jgi:O-acetyl-ADP-ribose deacetylase (regulator of RNase III)
MKINYVKGDATQPQGDGVKYIIHCCNDEGAWGAGFVMALSRRWEYPEVFYRNWAADGITYSEVPFKLGEIQWMYVEDNIVVCNMIGQHGTRTVDGVPPVRYDAIAECLVKVRKLIQDRLVPPPEQLCSVHCPRFGAGLAGGDWEKIEWLLQTYLVDHGVPVTVYDL